MSQRMFDQVALIEETQPVEVTLIELVTVLASFTEDENEIFATVDHMIEGGSVRITPTLVARLPEAY